MSDLFNNIPIELRLCRQWVTWKYEPNERGDMTKVPYNPWNGYKASPTNPKAWAPFDVAVKACKGRRHNGIGFVFTADDPYVGIDLDDCLDDAGEMVMWARQIVQVMGSYAEISPSGTGVKLWVKGSIPSSVRAPYHSGTVEMYQHSRYFTVTGLRLDGTADTIRHVDEELTKLYETLKPKLEQHELDCVDRAALADRRIASYVASTLCKVIDNIKHAVSGHRNNTLNNAAFTMGILIGTYGYNRTIIENALAAAANEVHLGEREIEQTLASGLNAGIAKSKDHPHVLRDRPLIE